MLNRSNTMKKLSIPSAMVGLTFGLIATTFVYLFVPPPSTASADSCEGASVYAWNCATSSDIPDCASRSQVEAIVKKYTRRYCD